MEKKTSLENKMFKVTKVGGARSLDPKPVFQVRPLKRKGGAKKLGIAQAKTIKRKVFKKKLGLKQFFF